MLQHDDSLAEQAGVSCGRPDPAASPAVSLCPPSNPGLGLSSMPALGPESHSLVAPPAWPWPVISALPGRPLLSLSLRGCRLTGSNLNISSIFMKGGILSPVEMLTPATLSLILALYFKMGRNPELF